MMSCSFSSLDQLRSFPAISMQFSMVLCDMLSLRSDNMVVKMLKARSTIELEPETHRHKLTRRDKFGNSRSQKLRIFSQSCRDSILGFSDFCRILRDLHSSQTFPLLKEAASNGLLKNSLTLKMSPLP